MKKILLFIFITSVAFGVSYESIQSINQKDISILKKDGIDIKEKTFKSKIDWSKGEGPLFELAKKKIEKEYDIMNAFKILNFLTLNHPKDEYLFYLGKCYFLIGEFYYEGYIEKNFRMAYDIFKKISEKNKDNIEYLRWLSYSAAGVGSFIRHKEDGLLSGLSYLREANSKNEDILKINQNDEDALLTKAEAEIESSSIPLLGGSEKKGYALIERVLSANPNNLRAHLLKGKYAYKRENNMQKALFYINKGIEIFDKKLCPQDSFRYIQRISLDMHLVRIYKIIQDHNQLWIHLRSHLSMLPRSVSGLDYLFSYLKDVKKDKTAACEIAKKLVEIDPYGRKEKEKNEVCN